MVAHTYGASETGIVSALSPAEHDRPERFTCAGRIRPGVEVRFRRSDGSLAGPGEPGVVEVRSPQLASGYRNRPAEAAAAFVDGWYRTGDVGVLDADGYLSITDRISDIIIRGGENISAQEVEELMLGMDAIAEVSVIAAPDDRLGEHAAAVVRVRPGTQLPTLAQIREHLSAAGLAKQKWPESLHEVADFPRTPSGKVQKFHLRQALREGRLPAVEG